MLVPLPFLYIMGECHWGRGQDVCNQTSQKTKLSTNRHCRNSLHSNNHTNHSSLRAHSYAEWLKSKPVEFQRPRLDKLLIGLHCWLYHGFMQYLNWAQGLELWIVRKTQTSTCQSSCVKCYNKMVAVLRLLRAWHFWLCPCSIGETAKRHIHF